LRGVDKTIRDVAYLLASLLIFGFVYLILNLVIGALQMVFTIDDAIVLAVYALWSVVPFTFYIGKAYEFFHSRGVARVED